MQSKSIDNSTVPLYPLRVAAELTHTSVYALRQYVDLGLILPFKTATNRRLYSNVDIQRIRCIRRYLDEYGLNIAGINALLAAVPCWIIKPCPVSDQKTCEAFTSVIKPCWQVSIKGPTCQNVDCRVCEVYRLQEECSDLKSIIKKLKLGIKK